MKNYPIVVMEPENVGVLEMTINAFYECGINNDKLNLIYMLNNKSEFAVKIGNISFKKTTIF